MSESEIQRILDRAGLSTAPSELHPLAYTDRHGDIHLPLDAAVALARAFAAAASRGSATNTRASGSVARAACISAALIGANRD